MTSVFIASHPSPLRSFSVTCFYSFSPLFSQFFEYCEEAEWVVEVMKTTGKPTAITMSIGPAGDSNNVPPQECAVRLARTGIIRFYEPFPLCGQRH